MESPKKRHRRAATRARTSPRAEAEQGLFAETVHHSTTRALIWIQQPRARPIPQTKAGQEYQRLLEKIQAMQAEITSWERCLTEIQARAGQEIIPLQAQYGEELLTLFALLEDQLQNQRLRWGKVQRSEAWKSLWWFAEESREFLSAEHEDALDLFCRRCQEECGMMVEEDSGIDDPEEEALIQAILESLGMRQADPEESLSEKDEVSRAEETTESQTPTGGPDWEAFFRQAGAQKAEEIRQAAQKTAAEMQHHTMLRSWYRRLVSLLHPDREQDPEERQRKTRQLQHLHHAYQTGDVWQILQQAEAFGIAKEAFAGEKALQTLNQTLRKQRKRLQEQLEQTRQEIRNRFGLPPFGQPRPETLEAHYARDLQNWKQRIQKAQEERERLAASPKETKRWLQELHRERKSWERQMRWWGELQ